MATPAFIFRSDQDAGIELVIATRPGILQGFRSDQLEFEMSFHPLGLPRCAEITLRRAVSRADLEELRDMLTTWLAATERK